MFDRSTGQGTLVLNEVRMYVRETNVRGVSSVQLFFDRLARGIRVAAVAGSIECSKVSCDDGAGEEERLFPNPFWTPLLGSVLVCSWHMTNEQGRADALELRLQAPGSAAMSRIVRMEATGCELLVSEMDEVRRVVFDSEVADEPEAGPTPDRLPTAMPN